MSQITSEQPHVTISPEKKDASYGHVLKYTGVFGGVQVLGMLMSIARNKVAAVLIGQAGFGLISIYNSVAELVAGTTNLGIPFCTVRQLAELQDVDDKEGIRNYVRLVRTWCLWTAVAAFLLCLLLAPLISYLVFEGSWDYAHRIAALAPLVFMLMVCVNECAVLKGLRRLRRVALISACSAVLTLFCTVPFLYALHIDGLLWALNLSMAASMIVHLAFSTRVCPWEVSLFSKKLFLDGREIVRIGIPFVMAGIAGSLAALAIPVFLTNLGSLEAAGLYKVGYGLMLTYAGMVFVSFEADYFPRLSAVGRDVKRQNRVINQQIDVGVMLMAPFLIIFLLAMPFVVRMLYSEEFLEVVSMTVCSAFYMFFRAMMLPLSYMALARGDSRLYFLMELVYDVVSVALIVGGYYWGGLIGSGVALSVAGWLDWLFITLIYSRRYGFRYSAVTLKLSLIQGLCLAVVVLLCLHHDVPLRYAVGGLLWLVSLYLSIRYLHRNTTFFQTLKSKFLTKLGRQ